MKIIHRTAPDDFYALHVAIGMENAGASVFAITQSDMGGRWLAVWAKFRAPITTGLIDEAISKATEEPK